VVCAQNVFKAKGAKPIFVNDYKRDGINVMVFNLEDKVGRAAELRLFTVAA
jgi:hypothetical protein